MTNSRTNPTPQQAAAQQTKKKFFVIEDHLYYQAKAGDELKFNLDFPSSALDRIYALEEDADDREQFWIALEEGGDKALIARVKKMGALEQSQLINHFFTTFRKMAGAPLGESESSSDS